MRTKIAVFASFLAVAVGMAGCSSSDFKSGSGTRAKEDKSSKGSPSAGGEDAPGSGHDGDDAPDGKLKHADDGPEGADGDSDPGAVDGDGDIAPEDNLEVAGANNSPAGASSEDSNNAAATLDDAASASAGAIVTEDEASCLLKKGDDFRVLFVFDNSGSTRNTDPKNIRREAALRLVDQFTDFVKANPKAVFKTATVHFYDQAFTGAHGWVKLAEGTRANIEADITAATTKPGSGTHFDKGMIAADEMLVKDGAKASEKRQRTYIIVLSDGRANGAKRKVSDIVPLVTTMVDNRGAAVYSILIGKDGNDAAVRMMNAVALPVKGVVGPDHVGTYVHAPDADAIDKAFADFFKKVTGC